MDPALRIVTSLPLTVLWSAQGTLTHQRTCALGMEDIRERLKMGRVQFVVADVGQALHWVPAAACFDYFKDDVISHLVEPAQRFTLAKFPGEYCYCASEWSDAGSQPIILLEKHH